MGKNRFASKPNNFKSKQQSANSTNKQIVLNRNNTANVIDLHTHSGGMYPTSDKLKVTGFSKEDGVLFGRNISTGGGLVGGSHDASGALDQSIVAFKDLAHGKTMAITEHNTMGGIAVLLKHLNEKIDTYNQEKEVDFPKYDVRRVVHRINGVNVIPGVEVTCVIPGIMSDKNKDLKVHMLVYGANFEPNGVFYRLLEAKHNNDMLRDQGLFKIIEKQFGIKFSEETIKEYIIDKQKETPGFGQFGPKHVVAFLQEKGISLPMTYEEVRNMLKTAPEPQRLQLSIEDVIKVAHASGGICILAHPNVNLNRVKLDATAFKTKEQRMAVLNKEKSAVIKKLLSFNIDGFEMQYNSYNPDGERVIRSTVKQCGLERTILYTGGSDTHFNMGDEVLDSTRMGKTKSGKLYDYSCSRFFAEIRDLDKARREGKLDNRETSIRKDIPLISDKDINDIVTKYEGTAKTYQDSFIQGVDNYFDTKNWDANLNKKQRDKVCNNYVNYGDMFATVYYQYDYPNTTISDKNYTYTITYSTDVSLKNPDDKTK